MSDYLHRRHKRKPRLSIEQIAEAFELHNKGVYYANIAMVFGVSHRVLRRHMKDAERYGFSFWGKTPGGNDVCRGDGG